MANNERLGAQYESEVPAAELEAARQEQQEKLNESRERAVEKEPQQNSEKLAQEAKEKANSAEKERTTAERAPNKERRKDGPIPQKERDASFTHMMSSIQQDMSAPSRVFSKLIHNKTVDRVSSAVGSTVARPNAILSGSICAFIFTLAIFLVARYYGYPLSGTETIAGFTLGWMVGLIYDYIRLEVTGGK